MSQRGAAICRVYLRIMQGYFLIKCIQFKPNLVADDGQVTDEKIADFLCNYISEFLDSIQRILAVLPRKG